MQPIALTDAEIEQITRRPTAAAQARVLKLIGIPFTPHPTDRRLIVSRAAAEAVLGGTVAVMVDQAQEFDMNIEALRGKNTTSR